MAIYRERIEAAIKPLLDSGFEVKSIKEVPQSFGNTDVVLASNDMRFRLISDRGQIFAYVAPPVGVGWYGLGELLAHAGHEVSGGALESPQVAVSILQAYATIVAECLAQPDFLAELVKRH